MSNQYKPPASAYEDYRALVAQDPSIMSELDDNDDCMKNIRYARSHKIPITIWFDYIVIQRELKLNNKIGMSSLGDDNVVVVLSEASDDVLVIDDTDKVTRTLDGVPVVGETGDIAMVPVEIEMVTNCVEFKRGNVECPLTTTSVLGNSVVDHDAVNNMMTVCTANKVDDIEELKVILDSGGDNNVNLCHMVRALSPSTQPVDVKSCDNSTEVVFSNFTKKNYDVEDDRVCASFLNVTLPSNSSYYKNSLDHMYTLNLDLHKYHHMIPLIDCKVPDNIDYINIHSRNRHLGILFANRYPLCSVRIIGNTHGKKFVAMSERDMYDSVRDDYMREATIAIFPDISRCRNVNGKEIDNQRVLSDHDGKHIRDYYKYYYRYVYGYSIKLDEDRYRITGYGYKFCVLETSLMNGFSGRIIKNLLYNQMWHFFYYNWIRKPFYCYVVPFSNSPHGIYDFKDIPITVVKKKRERFKERRKIK